MPAALQQVQGPGHDAHVMPSVVVPVPCENSRGARVTWHWCSSGDSLVFVDHTAEDLPPVDPSVEWNDGCGVVVGWAVPAALVRPVVVEVSGVLVEDCRGVAVVVDEDSVGALGPD